MYALAPPLYTPPSPWLLPSSALFICSRVSLDVNNSCNICQVINAGCLKGEGIIWELMTCVTKQYCVLWHFARLICVSDRSALPLYPRALPSGPRSGNTPTLARLVPVRAASLLSELIVCKGCVCQSSDFLASAICPNIEPQESKSAEMIGCFLDVIIAVLVACGIWRHQMSDSWPVLKFKGEIEGRGGCLMPCHRSFCITQLFSN